MPVFDLRPISWLKRPKNSAHISIVFIALCVASGMWSGCERDDGLDPDQLERADEHAAIMGQNKADTVLVEARDAVLTDPDSDRQQQSREVLLEMEKLEDQMPDDAESEEEQDESRRNRPVPNDPMPDDPMPDDPMQEEPR